ncbi:LOW QUALITY PROTEIN: hypothetical protein OSB04_032192 [Centaurea solstitialis]|uniref:Polyprotein n=1 Tax=Centaurea solstitialis TaxID=347529 RepID=A0AA38SAK1_9ASTR|nr:LOW QUALITY PROTEIN: hypothetical protein OSB04_032192 [Centaurea solstitialis]
MLFYLTMLRVSNVLTEQAPTNPPASKGQNVHTAEKIKEFQKAVDNCAYNEYSCRNYILNALDDSLYDIYSTFATARGIWKSLETKYKTPVACSKKFSVGKFLNFKMNDSHSIVKQVEELQILAHEVDVEISAIIEKLPPTLKDFKLYLKHLTEEMTFDQLEDNRKTKKDSGTSLNPNANMVTGNTSKEKFNNERFLKSKGKFPAMKHGFNAKTLLPPNKRPFKKQTTHCWVCRKGGHKTKDCRFKRNHGNRGGNGGAGPSNQANITDTETRFIGVIEANMTTNNWLDTGALGHICNSQKLFTTYNEVHNDEPMFMGNATTSKMEGKRKLDPQAYIREGTRVQNLISGPVLSNKGFKVVIESDKFVITKGGVYVGKGYLNEGLFKLNTINNPLNNYAIMNKTEADVSAAPSMYMLDISHLWHSRLGHVNYRSLQRMMNLNMLPQTFNEQDNKIHVESKCTSYSHKSVEKSNEVLGLIHIDLCDFKETPTRGGKNYYISFINDCSKFCYIYLIHTKDEALNMFKTYKAEVENQLDKKIKILRFDRGGEYESHEFAEFCSSHGIVHQTTAPYTPQQNGVAEQKNRTLKNMINSMLITFRAPHSLWGEITDFQKDEVWGCLAKVQVPLPKRTKLGPKTIDCIYLGPAKNNAAYRSLVYKSQVEDVHKQTFIETSFPYKDKEKPVSIPKKRGNEDITPQNESNPSVNPNREGTSIVQKDIEPRRSKHGKIAKDFGPDYMTFNVNSCPIRQPWIHLKLIIGKRPYINNTWKFVDLPPGHKPIEHKWIVKRKLRPEGTIEKYKARLVAKGYRQKESQDFFDTYSPVTRITSIRTLMAIAAIHNLEIHQMDMKIAFLNGELDEEIYMQQPEGFVAKGQKNKVSKLVKSLYGLKQAPKQWHKKFDKTLLSQVFQINECDKCIYVKQYKNACVIICFYMDDMLIMGTNLYVINQTKRMLSSSFDMKDLGVADVILGIKIHQNSEGYILSQSHYIEKVLKKFGHYEDRSVVTPFDPSTNLKKNQGDSIAKIEYTQVLGSLMYIMNCTRPDISYTVNRLSRYSHNLGKDHWYTLVRVLCYLKHTIHYGLHYTKFPPGYCDANWISNNSKSKSTSGYVFALGGASISWKASKQTVNTRSTMEAEFVALNKAAEQAEWLKSFLKGIPLWPKPIIVICIYCDSMAALTRANNQIYNGKSRHIRRRHNTIKDLLKNGIIFIDYIKSKANIADPLTKGLNREQVIFTSRGMGLKHKSRSSAET